MKTRSPVHRSFRRWGGFLVSGTVAAVVDAGITTALIRYAALDPFTARLFAILVAMMVAWLMHRRVTFNVAAAPTWQEFIRFIAVAWSANLLNYALYSAIMLFRPATLPVLAVVVATGVAAVFSYAGFRLRVFREPPPPV